VGTRSKVLWALAGAGAVGALELTLLGLFLGGPLSSKSRAQPTPSPIVIASPFPNAAASRFRELAIPKPGGTPYAIVTTLDGSVWFTESECTSGIGRLTKDARWDHWPLAPNCGSQPLAITVGPDRNVWYGDLSTVFPSEPVVMPTGRLRRAASPARTARARLN
jgi:streptogramin lyase